MQRQYLAGKPIHMISVNEAIELIRKNTGLLSPVSLPLQQAYSKVLAEDVYAGLSIPAFDQAAMDGYAIRFSDLMQTKEFIVSGEVAAGSSRHLSLQSFHAVRIFTGAAIPDGYDTVVMQEKTEANGNRVVIKDELLAQGTNVRREGTEIKKGEPALQKGIVLTPAAIGFLAALGITDVNVYLKPTVHIIVTGNELQTPGTPLQYGQVYESNSVMLQTALKQLHITDSIISVVGDNASEITTAITKALAKADLVLLTGGVSVGNYDFVVEACGKAGVAQLFHKVAQRPGKPLYCGRREDKIIFGLPGNPASVLSCFYTFVIVAIEELSGRKNLLERRQVPLLADFSKKIALTQFLKANCTGEGVMPLQAQESFRLSSFAVANCLLVLPEEKREYHAGDIVEILLLPNL